MKKSSIFHVIIIYIFALNGVFGVGHSAHAKQLTTIQEQSISQHFPLNKIIISEEPGFNLGVVTLGKDHRQNQYFFNLQYGKTIKYQEKNTAQTFSIKHYSINKVPPPNNPCRSKKLKSIPFQHPQLGSFIICAQQNPTYTGLIFATIYPTGQNTHPYIQYKYSGSTEDLLKLLKAYL